MFLIDGFDMPHRLDRNSNGGGLLLFVRGDIPSNLEDIPSNLVEAEANPVEGFYVFAFLWMSQTLIFDQVTSINHNDYKNFINIYLFFLYRYTKSWIINPCCFEINRSISYKWLS